MSGLLTKFMLFTTLFYIHCASTDSSTASYTSYSHRHDSTVLLITLMLFNTVWYYSILQCTNVQCGAGHYSALKYSALQLIPVQHNTEPATSVLHCSIIRSIGAVLPCIHGICRILHPESLDFMHYGAMHYSAIHCGAVHLRHGPMVMHKAEQWLNCCICIFQLLYLYLSFVCISSLSLYSRVQCRAVHLRHGRMVMHKAEQWLNYCICIFQLLYLYQFFVCIPFVFLYSTAQSI